MWLKLAFEHDLNNEKRTEKITRKANNSRCYINHKGHPVPNGIVLILFTRIVSNLSLLSEFGTVAKEQFGITQIRLVV